jgi:hypothetical protein
VPKVLVVAQIQASLSTIDACRETIVARLLLNHFGVEIVKVLRDLARHKIFTTETIGQS